MEIVSVLSVLRRYWLLVVLGFFLATLAGVSMVYDVSLNPPGFASRTTTGGVASAQSMLTTTAAPAFHLSNKSHLGETLPNRAVMLANLMAADEARTEIARRSRVDPDKLVVFGPAAGAPVVEVPIAVEGNMAANAPREPYRVFVNTQISPPIISIRATAPEAAEAARLAEAVRQTMHDELATSQGGEERIGSTSLGPVSATQVVSAPAKPRALIVTVVVFGFWCAAIVVVMSALPRLRRRRPAVAM